MNEFRHPRSHEDATDISSYRQNIIQKASSSFLHGELDRINEALKLNAGLGSRASIVMEELQNKKTALRKALDLPPETSH